MLQFIKYFLKKEEKKMNLKNIYVNFIDKLLFIKRKKQKLNRVKIVLLYTLLGMLFLSLIYFLCLILGAISYLVIQMQPNILNYIFLKLNAWGLSMIMKTSLLGFVEIIASAAVASVIFLIYKGTKKLKNEWKKNIDDLSSELLDKIQLDNTNKNVYKKDRKN
jgi:hypothetical protein